MEGSRSHCLPRSLLTGLGSTRAGRAHEGRPVRGCRPFCALVAGEHAGRAQAGRWDPTHCCPSLQGGRPPGLGKHCLVSRQGTTLRGSLISRVAWQGLCLNTAQACQCQRLPWASLPGQSSWGCDAPSGFQAPVLGAGQGGGARGHRSRAGTSGHSEEPESRLSGAGASPGRACRAVHSPRARPRARI